MAAITPHGVLDVYLIAARLRLQHWEKWSGDGEVATIPILEDGARTALIKGEEGWKALDGFLTRLSNQAAPLLGGKPAKYGDVWFERLLPRSRTPWNIIDDPDHFRLMIALSTPPNAVFYCGGDSAVLGVGVVNHIDISQYHSSVNHGDWPRVSICLNVRRPISLETEDE